MRQRRLSGARVAKRQVERTSASAARSPPARASAIASRASSRLRVLVAAGQQHRRKARHEPRPHRAGRVAERVDRARPAARRAAAGGARPARSAAARRSRARPGRGSRGRRGRRPRRPPEGRRRARCRGRPRTSAPRRARAAGRSGGAAWPGPASRLCLRSRCLCLRSRCLCLRSRCLCLRSRAVAARALERAREQAGGLLVGEPRERLLRGDDAVVHGALGVAARARREEVAGELGGVRVVVAAVQLDERLPGAAVQELAPHRRRPAVQRLADERVRELDRSPAARRPRSGGLPRAPRRARSASSSGARCATAASAPRSNCWPSTLASMSASPVRSSRRASRRSTSWRTPSGTPIRASSGAAPRRSTHGTVERVGVGEVAQHLDDEERVAAGLLAGGSRSRSGGAVRVVSAMSSPTACSSRPERRIRSSRCSRLRSTSVSASCGACGRSVSRYVPRMSSGAGSE